MNKAELVQLVAQDAGLTLKDAGSALDTVIDSIKSAVQKGNEVRLVGFGIFKAVRRAARVGINPKTKEKVQISAKTVPKFSASKEFKTLCG